MKTPGPMEQTISWASLKRRSKKNTRNLKWFEVHNWPKGTMIVENDDNGCITQMK